MKYSILFVIASVVVAHPQISLPKVGPDGKPLPQCQMTKDIKPMADPLQQFRPATANFPCDMGAAIPYGPVPKGCAKFEVIVGS